MITKSLDSSWFAFIASFALTMAVGILLAGHLKHTVFAAMNDTPKIEPVRYEVKDPVPVASANSVASTEPVAVNDANGGCGCPTCCAVGQL